MKRQSKRTNKTQRQKIRAALGGKAEAPAFDESIQEIACILSPQSEYQKILPEWNPKARKRGRYHGSNFWSVKGFGVNRWAVVTKILVDWETLLGRGMSEGEVFRGCIHHLNKIPPRKKFQRRQRRKPYGTLSYEPIHLSFKKAPDGTPFIETILLTDQRNNRNFWGEGMKL